MSSVTDRRLVVDEVIQQWDHCIASLFVPVLMWQSEEGTIEVEDEEEEEKEV